jgi:hypothetical protein
LQVLPPVIDVHDHSRIPQHIPIGVLEIAGVGEDVSGKIRDFDTSD